MTLKVINDLEHYVSFKKGNKIGHAESAIQIPNQETPEVFSVSIQIPSQETQEAFSVFDTASQPPSTAEQNDTKDQNLPAHLRQMYSDNISALSDHQKSKFKTLLSEISDVLKDDFDLDCLNSGVELKIQTHDEIPLDEKLRRTPLQFQK